ncbi:hypothetical protein Tco_0064198 [Tanacetum coccineum]
MVIKKLKERIKSLSGKMNEDKIKKDLEEIETINIELDHRVSKLIAENEHLKQTYKQLYDSIKPARIRSKEQCDDLINQVNLKSVEISDLNASLQEKVLVITALKDDLRKLKGKALVDCAYSKTAHSAYIKHTQEEAAVLRDLVEHVKSNYPLDHSLESACRYTKLIQELLTNISKTCPSINNSGEKLVAVTPKNKDKRVRFTEPVTSSGNTNTKTTSSSNLVSNKPMLSSTGVNPSNSASGSQPSGNTKKDKIQRTPSSTTKNKVEAHPRTVKSSLKNKNSVVEPKGNANVQHSKLNANSELLCVKCNGCMLSDNHDLCVLDFINNVNARVKSKSVKKSSKRKVWKPIGKMFINIGYIWRPTGRTFTIVGNACSLTRITTTAEVPLRKPTALESDTPKPVVTLVYSRKPRKPKTNVPVSKSKVLKSISANEKEPSKSWGSIVSDVSSSSLNECRHSHCMAWFEQLETHLRDLYLNSSSYAVDAFKPAFHSLFGEEHQTFRLKMFHNLDQRDLLENLDTLEAVIHRAVITYGRLQLQSQDAQINPVQAVDDSLNVLKSSWIESKNHNALNKSMNETQLQQHQSLVTESTTLEANLNTDVKVLDDGSVITESSETKSDMHDTSSSSRTYITHVVDANIRPVNDQVPSAEDAPEFCEFFEINDLKAQLQAKTTLICNLKNQIKSVKEASNEAKVKHEIDVLETINIELESSVAKLLAENEKLNKENEHLKQTYKELYDSIKKTRIQTKDHNDSLIAQVNSKTVENADLKAQIQEKVFANVALKNELRKLKGNSVDTKFAKPSILGKPVLQPPRNQSVVRQPNAFKSERPNFSKPRFASQVDVNNVLSKPVTPHYLPKVREYVLAKPHHVIAPGSSRNSQEESYGSNDMAHNHYLEEARKKTQERNRNSKPSVMHTTSLQNTTNGSKPNPRSNNQISRSLPVSKSSCGMSNGVSLVDHSRNSSSFSDSKHFVCSSCHKCVFDANHDNCITKFLKEVNSHAKVQSLKTRNINKPVEPKSHTQKPGRQIAKGQRFSPKKSSDVHEKPNTPRSCLRWKPTGRIFKIAGLRWIPTGKMFTDNTTKVDSEPPNCSNGDITNPYECNQTLNVSAGTTNLSADLGHQLMTPGPISSGLVSQPPSPTPNVPPTKNDRDTLFFPMFDEYFNHSPSVVQPVNYPNLCAFSKSTTRAHQKIDQGSSA